MVCARYVGQITILRLRQKQTCWKRNTVSDRGNLDFLWDRRKSFEDFARDFHETDGLACPGVMSLAGQTLGDWEQYSLSPTNSAWSAHLFYLHWRYTMDDQFLSERAYPWASGVGTFMLGLLKSERIRHAGNPTFSFP